MGLSQRGRGLRKHGAGKRKNLSDGIEIDLKFMCWAMVFLQGEKWGAIILEILVHMQWCDSVGLQEKESKGKFLQSFQVFYKTDDFLDNLRDTISLVSRCFFFSLQNWPKGKRQAKMCSGTCSFQNSLMPAPLHLSQCHWNWWVSAVCRALCQALGIHRWTGLCHHRSLTLGRETDLK